MVQMNANELADVFDTYAEPHDWGIQAKNMLRQMGLAESIIAQQKLEIQVLKAALISENEACAQILLDSYDTTEPYESISPDWLLTLVDLIDNRVGRVRE
jgi:hypothetical protein